MWDLQYRYDQNRNPNINNREVGQLTNLFGDNFP